MDAIGSMSAVGEYAVTIRQQTRLCRAIGTAHVNLMADFMKTWRMDVSG